MQQYVANTLIENILLVEGKSDIKFFETLLAYMALSDSSLEVFKFQFAEIGGSDDKLLEKSLRSLETDIRKNPIRNIGVIMDLDEFSETDRFTQLQNALETVFTTQKLSKKDDSSFLLKVNETRQINVKCHFVETQDITNLELLLQELVTETPIAANCLKNWYDRATTDGRKIKQSDYLKFWREVYVRYDFCSDKTLSKHASENCSLEKSYENMLIETSKKAWNFEHLSLNKVKAFLIGLN